MFGGFGTGGASSLFGAPAPGQPSAFLNAGSFFGKQQPDDNKEMDNDEEDGVQEDNEAPIYAETDKIEFKTGVSVAKSPYTKIFEVSM